MDTYAVSRNKSSDTTFIQLARSGHILNKSYCNFKDSKYGRMKYFILLCICLINFKTVSGTHIIGGSMSYSYLGNNMYSIRLEVLRDCASAGANFDNPASIGIFDKDGNLVLQKFVTHSAIEPVSINPNSVCIFPPNVCVEKTHYEFSVTLPFIEGGYSVSYQRCCRSNIIVNLENPEENGMTLYTHINVDQPNNSPLFVEEFPFAVFVNTPFLYEAYAIDPDGDSLAYELAAPFLGGDTINIIPQPPLPPPYATYVFKSPYSVDNMLGGDYPLTIDPITGEMTAIPPTTGVFQLSYAVKEYRNGEHIGTYYREFAFVSTYQAPPNLNFDISGSVVLNDSMSLDAGKVQIFQWDITTDSLHLYEEKEIGPDPSYSFEDVPAGVFYIKAIVDSTSVYYDTYLPTYYNGVCFWYNATNINQCDTSRDFRDIHLFHVDSLDGIHILDGVVNFAGHTNLPVPGLNLLLANSNGDPIQARTTDDDGYFKFEHLPEGTYKLFADLINSGIDNTHAPQIDLVANSTISAWLYNDSLSLQVPVNVFDRLAKEAILFNLYPNPVSDKFTIEMKYPEDKSVRFELLDVNGHILYSGSLTTNKAEQISASYLSAGVYFIKIENDGMYEFFKVVKE